MIIKTLLDTDLYKFTTSYAYFKTFPYSIGTFTFKDRNEREYSEEFLQSLKDEIVDLSMICLSEEELEYMTSHCRFLPRLYWEWLSSFRFDPKKIKVSLDKHHHLSMEVTDYLYKSTLYEVPLLSLVSELTNQISGNYTDGDKVISRLYEKVKLSNENKMPFSEFGTRRRFSFDVQDAVLCYINEMSNYCTGTSNCFMAKKYGMKMMGTHPHEWFMFHGAQYGYRHANYMALENWVNVYDGDLGIALADTYTFKVFLEDFSRKQAKLFDGVRCDSGDEYVFINLLLQRYKEFGIDSTTKTIIFSNALNFNKVLDIWNYCKGKIRCGFGIGTNLTNDTGFEPSNIVMKLSRCRINEMHGWKTCIKLSDDLGKHTGDKEEVQACMNQLGIKEDIEG